MGDSVDVDRSNLVRNSFYFRYFISTSTNVRSDYSQASVNSIFLIVWTLVL